MRRSTAPRRSAVQASTFTGEPSIRGARRRRRSILSTSIDREYTLRYLCGNTTIANDIEREWQTMKEMISGFFIPVAQDPAFAAKAEMWLAAGNPWDTSVMKVIDNMLIGSRKYAVV
jgi:hypothetical protein